MVDNTYVLKLRGKSIHGKSDVPGRAVGFRSKFMCCLVARVASLQGKNLLLSYLQLFCCQLRFRFSLPIIVLVREGGGAERSSLPLFWFAKGAELKVRACA